MSKCRPKLTGGHADEAAALGVHDALVAAELEWYYKPNSARSPLAIVPRSDELAASMITSAMAIGSANDKCLAVAEVSGGDGG